MPKMNGRELADRVVRQRPDIRILFMSGYTGEAMSHQEILIEPGRQFLQKPFTMRNPQRQSPPGLGVHRPDSRRPLKCGPSAANPSRPPRLQRWLHPVSPTSRHGQPQWVFRHPSGRASRLVSAKAGSPR